MDRDHEQAARNTRIAELWVNEGWSVNRLADEFGLSPKRVRDIIHAQGYAERDRKRRPRLGKAHERKPLSTLHAQLGNDVCCRRTTVLHLNAAQFAARVRLSVPRLRRLEAGTYDPTLDELNRVAGELGLTVSYLVTPRSAAAAERRSA